MSTYRSSGIFRSDSSVTSATGQIDIPFTYHGYRVLCGPVLSAVASNKLIAVVLHYSKSDDPLKATAVKIYTLNFVPEPNNGAAGAQPAGGHVGLFALAIALAVLLTVVIVLYAKKKGRALPATRPRAPSVPEQYAEGLNEEAFMQGTDKKLSSSIFLFGQFQVF